MQEQTLSRRKLLFRGLSVAWPVLVTGAGMFLTLDAWAPELADAGCGTFLGILLTLGLGSIAVSWAHLYRSHRASDIGMVLLMFPLGALLLWPAGLAGSRLTRLFPSLCTVTCYETVDEFHVTATGPGNDRSYRFTDVWFGASALRFPNVSVRLTSYDYTLAWTDGPHPSLTRDELAELMERGGLSMAVARLRADRVFSFLGRCRSGRGFSRPTWRSDTPTPWNFVFHSDDQILFGMSLVVWVPLVLCVSMALSRKCD